MKLLCIELRRCERPSRMSPLLEVTEDTPPDMLAGSMDLRLVIPDGKRVRMSVDRRTPMMDLLVQVTTAYKISPAGYVLQPYGETGLLPYKPSTPIGALDTWIVHIVPKNQSLQNPSNKINLKQIIPPFEQTLRFQVNLPRNQLYVTRVSGRCSMRDILQQACSEKNLDPSKYTLRHPKQLDKPLCDELSIAEYGHNQVTMLSIKNLPTAVLTEDILQMNKYKAQSDSGSGSAASSVSPVVPVQPSKPVRKRRPAPKPPVQQRKEQSQKQQSETIICHSRTSSDSSGYHEASVLSESPDSNNSSLPDSLPRRSKLPAAETNSSRETNKLSRSLSNLHQASTSAPAKSNLKPAQSVSCLAPSRKKKPAPAPPVAIVEEKEDKSATLPPCSRLMDSAEERTEMAVNKKPAPVRAPSPVNTVDINKETICSKPFPPINCYSSSPSKTVEKLCPSQPVAKLLKNFETPLNSSNSRQSHLENPSIPLGHVKSLSEKFVISSENQPVINKIRQQIKSIENGFISQNNRLLRQNNFGRTMRTFSECSFSSIPESLANRKSSCVSDSVSLIPSNLMEELEARISGRSNNVKMILKRFETEVSVCNDKSESYENTKITIPKEPLNGFNETLISNDNVTSEGMDNHLCSSPDCEEQEAIFLDDRNEPSFYNDLADPIHLENDITSIDNDELQNEHIEIIRNSLDKENIYLTNDESVYYDGENDSLSGSSNSYDNGVALGNSENEHNLLNGIRNEKEPEESYQATIDFSGEDFVESVDINCSLAVGEPIVNMHLGREQIDLNAESSDIYDDIPANDSHYQSINGLRPDSENDQEEMKIVKTDKHYDRDSDSNSDTSDSLSQFQTFNSSPLDPNVHETDKYLTKCSDSPILEHENSVNNTETPHDDNNICDDETETPHEDNNICDDVTEFNQNVNTTATSKFSSPPRAAADRADVMIPEDQIVQQVADSKIDGRRESLFSNNSAIYESMESIQEKIEENKLASKEMKFKQKNKTVTFCEPKIELDTISENEYSKPSKREKTRFSSPLKLGLWTRKGKALLFGKKKKTQEPNWTHVDNFSFCDCPDPDVVYIRVPDPSENDNESRMKRNESPMSDNSDHTYMAMNGIKAGISEVAYEMSESELVRSKLSELLNSRPDEFL